MPERPWPQRLVVALVSLTMVGCGLADLLQSPGLEDVTFTFAGPTTMRVGERAPFTVTALAGGAELSNLPLRITLPDSSAVRLTAGRDSLVAVAVGKDTLHVWLVHSIITGEEPHFQQEIRVQGGPGGALQP
jgi:hypothetical protein